MSDKKPPASPNEKSGSERPGLATRNVAPVMDAVPTEAEGDALFDELFGDERYEEDEDGMPVTPLGDEPATMMMQRSDLGLPPVPKVQQPAQPAHAGHAAHAQQPHAYDAPPESEEYDTHRPPPAQHTPAVISPSENTMPLTALRSLDPALSSRHPAAPDHDAPYSGAPEAVDPNDDTADTGRHQAVVEEEFVATNQYPRAGFDDNEIGFDEAVVEGEYADVGLDDVQLVEDTPDALPAEGGPGVDFAEALRPSQAAPLDRLASAEADDLGQTAMMPDRSPLAGLQPGMGHPFVAPPLPGPPRAHRGDTPRPTDESEPAYDDESSDGAVEVDIPEPGRGSGQAARPAPARDAGFRDAVVDADEIDEVDALEIAALEAEPARPQPRRTPRRAAEDGAIAVGEAADGTDAVVTLMQQGQRDAWVDRADWLYDEAPEPARPTERAHALLVVSELYAMAGEEERAEMVAREALQLAPSLPMAYRQLRGILMSRGRWTEVADALDAECRVAPTNQAKLHAAYLGAEVARLALGDPDGANRRLETAERVGFDDVRVPLARVMQALASSDEVPAARFESAATQPIGKALDVLAAVRSDGNDGDAGDSPYAALLTARAALRKRDIGRAVAALGKLESLEELSGGVAWLISALAAPHKELRSAAMDALSRVTGGAQGSLATRARAARALEVGDAGVVGELTNGAPDDVLTASERLVLAALAGASLNEPERWISDAADDEPSLAAAAASALNRPARDVGEPTALAAVTLGRALGKAASSAADGAGSSNELGEEDDDLLEMPDGALVSPSRPPRAPGLPSELVDAAVQLVDTDPNAGSARAVMLEHAYTSGQVARVATALGSDGAEGLAHERALAGALLAELAGDHEQMERDLERVIAERPDNEAAMRMSMVIAEAAAGADSLSRFGDAVGDDTRAALAYTEAGLRLMEEEGTEADGESLLRRAAAKAPDLPVASFIGMYIAQALGDHDAENFWLRERRKAAGEPGDMVMDNVRAALQLPLEERAERSNLLEEAHRARPDDYSLRELYEQAAGVSADRARWLVERANAPTAGAAAAPLALEAALVSELENDLELAARAARRAAELGDRRLAPIFMRRFALRGHGADEVLQSLSADLRQTEDHDARAELLELMARVEAHGRGDRDKAAEYLRAILREQPTNLAALHAIEAMAFSAGDVSGIGDVCLAIAGAVDGSESVAHAQMAARVERAAGKWEDSYDAVKLAFSVPQPGVWAMRQMSAHARARGDNATAASIDCTLAEGTQVPLDRATLLLRAAESSMAAGDEQVGGELLREVVDLWPRHQIALLERAAHLERAGATAEAAHAYEDLGMACQAPHERTSRLYKAATLWLSLETGEGQDEGRRLLEAVGTLDPTFGDTFDRLQALYLASGAKRELAELLAARLETVTDPEERVELEVLRGKMLVEAGSAGEARAALSAALEANPDNPEALSAFADVCAAEGAWNEVEQSIIRLGRLVSDPERQCEIYLRLGALYDEHLPNPERAEMAYQEVLKRAPENGKARTKLVELYLKNGQTERAFEQQEELINSAVSLTDKCLRTVKLAEIYEAAGDEKQAEQTLIKARRTWGKEPSPMAALYRFYQRNGQAPAADMLLERAAADVRRGLGAGRFEGPLFAMAQMVAELRGQTDAAEIARATLAAIEGEPAHIEGAGMQAGQPELDEHTAPEVLTPAFRQLLRATGDVMDEAVPFDIRSLRAKPLPPSNADVIERTMEIAAAYGLPNIQLVATNALGKVCIPARSEPPTICMGLPLVTAEIPAARDFLIHRAMKVLQSRTAALSRTAPIDLWPLVAAYLQLHSASFQPQGVDPAKLSAFKAAMATAMPPPDPQLNLLASEVIGSIGNRASSLNTVTNAWGSRSALLAMGDPNLALEAIAWSGGNQNAPPAGAERVRWIGRQAEARDLIVFSVSDGYVAARAALGVESPIDAVEFVDVEDD